MSAWASTGSCISFAPAPCFGDTLVRTTHIDIQSIKTGFGNQGRGFAASAPRMSGEYLGHDRAALIPCRGDLSQVLFAPRDDKDHQPKQNSVHVTSGFP